MADHRKTPFRHTRLFNFSQALRKRQNDISDNQEIWGVWDALPEVAARPKEAPQIGPM